MTQDGKYRQGKPIDKGALYRILGNRVYLGEAVHKGLAYPGERAAIIQCYYQDLSHEEAAYVLGCPLGTVKTNVLRGKRKLREVLAAWAPQGKT